MAYRGACCRCVECVHNVIVCSAAVKVKAEQSEVCARNAKTPKKSRARRRSRDDDRLAGSRETATNTEHRQAAEHGRIRPDLSSPDENRTEPRRRRRRRTAYSLRVNGSRLVLRIRESELSWSTSRLSLERKAVASKDHGRTKRKEQRKTGTRRGR